MSELYTELEFNRTPAEADESLLAAAHAYCAFIMDEAGILEAAQKIFNKQYDTARWENEKHDIYDTDKEAYTIPDGEYEGLRLTRASERVGNKMVKVVALQLMTVRHHPETGERVESFKRAELVAVHADKIVPRGINPDQAEIVDLLVKGLEEDSRHGLVPGLSFDLTQSNATPKASTPIRKQS